MRSRDIEKMGWMLVMFVLFVCFMSGFTRQTPDSAHAPGSLRVPHIGQIGDDLCWAACTEMVTRYYNTKDSSPVITQCQAAQTESHLWNIPCNGTVPVNDSLNFQTSPENVLSPNYHYDTYQYDSTLSAEAHPKFENSAMPYASLDSELAAGRPIIFSWYWSGIVADNGDTSQYGFHFLVAEGIPTSRYTKWKWVTVNDPEPVGSGMHRIMLYWEYAGLYPTEAPDGRGLKSVYSRDFLFWYHSGDIYHIYPMGGGQ